MDGALKILAFDPGKSDKSFAYSVLDRSTVTQYGIVRPIASLLGNEYNDERNDFTDRIMRLYGEVQPDCTVIERFLDRGGGKGTTGEFISIMIGIISVVLMPASIDLVSASTWKNYLARNHSIGRTTKKRACQYENTLALLHEKFPSVNPRERGATRMVVHEADSIGMAIWKRESSGKKTDFNALVGPNTVKIDV